MTVSEITIDQEEEKRLIQRAYKELLSCLKDKLHNNEADSKAIREAYELAVQAHSKQRRKSGEPYILHPIAVAKICVEEIGLGPTAVVTALLHDVVEDTNVTLEQIRAQFGAEISKKVDGLTKLDHTYSSDSPQAENFRKVLSTLVDDVRVVLIKMADRLHNMRTIGSMPKEKKLKIAAETSYIYAPLAHRLGLYNFRTEFLDLCMKITDEIEYKKIAERLQETKEKRETYIQSFIAPLDSQLKAMGIKQRIIGRPKSIYSIYNKIRNKQVEFEDIYDLFAVRIILQDVPRDKEKSLCWSVYSVVTDHYTPIPDRLKDWTAVPKSNGYESLHTTVLGKDGRYVEVQIRTERMDEIAERGYAAHWKYKGVGHQSDVYERWLDSVREILDDPKSDAVEFLGDFKSNSLFTEEVYVFTPRGEMRTLPAGATALDFAFSVHTDIGSHCQAVYVNSRLEPFGYQLRNGDQVKVITHKNQRPTEDWLRMVTTGRARSKIRSALKEDRRKQGELGQEALLRKFKHLRVHHYETAVAELVKHYNLASPTDLYFNIATEQISVQSIFKIFRVESGKLVLQEPLLPLTPDHGPHRSSEGHRPSPNRVRLLINGEPGEQYEYTFASCCNAVQGDEIFAYLTVTAGLKIHRINCPNATNLMVNYGYRVMKAEWITSHDTQFVAELLITGIDSGLGVIEQLTHEISSENNINIRSFSISGEGGYFEARISLVVKNTDQLRQVIRSLENLDPVSTVSRIE